MRRGTMRAVSPDEDPGEEPDADEEVGESAMTTCQKVSREVIGRPTGREHAQD
jgi:hypothetical protein